MPSFTQSQIEEWRQERVQSTDIPKHIRDDAGSLRSYVAAVVDRDIADERLRLQRAAAQVAESKANLKTLNKKRVKVLARANKLESP
jgi:hypothetical protein